MLSRADDILKNNLATEDKASLTESLLQVAKEARAVWNAEPDSPELDLLAQRLGDAARDESVRIPLGDSGLLELFCSIVSTQGLRPSLVVQCLRIIGNSSADQDENRARVVSSGCIPSLVAMLNDDSILPIIISVLFNVGVDFEPAQKALYKAGINPELVSLLTGPRAEDAASLTSFIYKLLGFVATQEPETNLVDPTTPSVLLVQANNQSSPVDVEDFLLQVSVALTYLAQEKYQETFLQAPDAAKLALAAFRKTCTGLDRSQMSEEDQAQHKQVQATFIQTLADLSAHPLFASPCPIDGDLVRELQQWISEPVSQLQSAACLVLGNVARSDDKCIYLVHKCSIHKPLIATLEGGKEGEAGLQHSILGFLKNLAIARQNKALIGQAGLFTAPLLPRIWDTDVQPQVQFDAVSLARLLVTGCRENVELICRPLPPDGDSTSSKQEPGTRTGLQIILDVCKRSDQEPMQMETARTAAAVCRILHTDANPDTLLPPPFPSSPSLSSSNTTPLEAFYHSHPGITDAILRLATQTKFPVLRSDALFVFALMARTPEGAQAIAHILHHSEAAAVIVAAVTGETPSDKITDSPPPATKDHESATIISALEGSSEPRPSVSGPVAAINATDPSAKSAAGTPRTTAEIDRSNALVLIANLLRHYPATAEEGHGEKADRDGKSDGDEKLPPSDVLNTFDKLLRESGRQLLREQNEN
ncbi:ARM repeat-containing protein [Poronia punctata]|nr:ARM repeat-containing protein [Poronia punctata]